MRSEDDDEDDDEEEEEEAPKEDIYGRPIGGGAKPSAAGAYIPPALRAR